MFELKVLAAVFLSLLVIGVGMTQGILGGSDGLKGVKDISILDRIRGLANFDGFLNLKEEYNSSVNIQSTVEPEDSGIVLEIGEDGSNVVLNYQSTPNSSLTLGEGSLSSISSENAELNLKSFRGSITYEDQILTLRGKIVNISAGDLEVHYPQPEPVKFSGLDLNYISIEGLPQTHFKFDSAGGSFKIDDSSGNFTEEEVSLTAFTGNLTIEKRGLESLAYNYQGFVSEASFGKIGVPGK